MATTKDKDIDQLNSFLRGEISAVETYQQCLEKLESNQLASTLNTLKASHQSRAKRLREEITRLGGEPAEGAGVWGGMTKLAEGGAKLFGEKAAISMLEEGEDHGLKDYKRDYDDVGPEIRNLIATQMLPEQQRTHDRLSELKHTL